MSILYWLLLLRCEFQKSKHWKLQKTIENEGI